MLKLDIQLFAVPFRKVSKTRKRMRRSHNALTIPGMVACPSCGEMIKSSSCMSKMWKLQRKNCNCKKKTLQKSKKII